VETLRANTSFWAGRRLVHRGDELPADDPVIAGREHLFETATPAAPPARTAAKKQAAKKQAAKKQAAKKAVAKKAAPGG